MWNLSNYGNDLNITKKQALSVSHPGQCLQDVIALMNEPKIKRQLKKLNSENLKKELSGYGTWDDEELQNHEENLIRWLWISCGDIVDGIF